MSNKAVRVTIMLNSDLQRQLRKIQAKRLQILPSTSVSFSQILNEVLAKGLTKTN